MIPDLSGKGDRSPIVPDNLEKPSKAFWEVYDHELGRAVVPHMMFQRSTAKAILEYLEEHLETKNEAPRPDAGQGSLL